MTGKLEIDADLMCLVDDRVPVKLSGANAALQLHLNSLKDFFELSRRHAPNHQTRVMMVRRVHHTLKQVDLSASLMIAGREVASLTPLHEGGPISKLLGLGPLRLRPLAILLILVMKRRPS